MFMLISFKEVINVSPWKLCMQTYSHTLLMFLEGDSEIKNINIIHCIITNNITTYFYYDKSEII